MKIKTLHYRHKKNLGNYETSDLEATADVGEDESEEDVFMSLVEFVHAKLDEIMEARND